MRAVTLSSVGHTYRRGRAVLQTIDLEVHRGEVAAVIGPSGSGKSTLLSIVGGLLAPTEGSVQVGDGPRRRGRPRLAEQRGIGWVFQTTNALGHRSVIDNVALPDRLRGGSEAAARDRAAELVDMLGLAAVATARASSLSGGELQRVCIARALAARPDVIVADEPTGQLDRVTSEQIGVALATAARAGAGVLIATHDHRLAAFADTVHRLVDGGLTRG